MDVKELNVLAQLLEEVIFERKDLTAAEVICLLSLLDSRVKRSIDSNLRGLSTAKTPVDEEDKESTNEQPKPEHARNKSIPYDAYDPPPPSDADPLPPRVEGANLVLAKANQACLCTACNSICYMTTKEIRDNCSVSDFVGSFKPMGNFPVLTKKIEIQNVDGTIAIDCPACGASKSLQLTRGKSTSNNKGIVSSVESF